MGLVNGIHHLTFITEDLDRLIAYYKRVFDADVTLDLEEGPVRHAFIQVGETTVLHPFQLPETTPPGSLPMFERGRLDHFALNATSEAAFREIRTRVIAEGRDDCVVIDMGLLLLFNFTDPDDGEHEVVLWKSDGSHDKILRKDWTYIKDF